jgi:hypothetical protein
MPTLARGRKGDPGPPGPPGSGGGGGTADTFGGNNQEAVGLPAGTPVCVHPTGSGFLRASAADNLRNAVGLLASDAAAGAATEATLGGVVTLDDWTAVAGTTTLAPRAVYFVGVTPGTLTNTPPSAAGNVVQAAGVAVGPYSLDLTIAPPILL